MYFCKDCKYYRLDETRTIMEVGLRYYCSRETFINYETGKKEGIYNNLDSNKKGNCPYFIRLSKELKIDIYAYRIIRWLFLFLTIYILFKVF